jgi:hypothetical protein
MEKDFKRIYSVKRTEEEIKRPNRVKRIEKWYKRTYVFKE